MVTPPDSSSFHAALAQTSAAVVGLFGAVLGSQILQHLAAMREERRELLERINLVYAHHRERMEHWFNFKDFLERKIAREAAILAVGTAMMESLDEMTWEGKIKSHPESAHFDPEYAAEEDLRLLQRVMPVYEPLKGEVHRSHVAAYAVRLRECAGELPEHTKATHLVAHDAAMFEKLHSRISRFRARLFPRSFLVVLLVLAWLSITGIVWPLATLPGLARTTSEPLMLLALAVGLLFLIGYFAYQLRALTTLGRIHWTRPH